MLPDILVTHLARFQFAFTTIFHFLFVPLTLGLTWLLVIMEAAYIRTGNEAYKDMVRFWGKLLAINFAIGVISGITLEFEFGLDWSYFSRTIGGSFGPILAIEGITAFMLEATMFGLFFFTWDKVSKRTHFIITLLLAFGASLSIVNILAANSWMQHPVATAFNVNEMSIQLKSIAMLYLNSLAQIRIGHVAFAGFLVASFFVMGISAFYLLKGRDHPFALRSFAVACGFGFIVSIAVLFFGDQNGLQVAKLEPEKMAAIEAQWKTQKAPAAWYLIAFPDQAQEKNYFTIKIPYALSLIATHSLTGTVPGFDQIAAKYKGRVENGIKAVLALKAIREKRATPQDIATFKRYEKDLGFGFLVRRFTDNVANATPADIAKAVKFAFPSFFAAFWTFRIMIGIWFVLFVLLILGLYYTFRRKLTQKRWYLRCVLYAIPLPYIAAEAGWILAEYGRQPWSVHEVLPTFMGTSSLSLSTIIFSICCIFLFYLTLISVELFLMFKYARMGPSSLHTGKYHFEK